MNRLSFKNQMKQIKKNNRINGIDFDELVCKPKELNMEVSKQLIARFNRVHNAGSRF